MVASVLIVNDTKCDWLRTVFYITYSLQSVVIVKQERDLKNLWQNLKDISLLFGLIDVVQLFDLESTQPNIALPYSFQQTPSYKKEFVYDVSMIQEPLRSLLYQYDLLEIPIYPNQEQSSFEVGFLNAYWGVKDPELPELNETQQESTRYNQENCDSGYSARYSYPTFSLLNPPSESQHQPNQTRSQKQQQQQVQSTSSTTPFEQQQQQLVTPPNTIISSSSSQPRGILSRATVSSRLQHYSSRCLLCPKETKDGQVVLVEKRLISMNSFLLMCRYFTCDLVCVCDFLIKPLNLVFLI